MIKIVLYDDWIHAATKKIRVEGKMIPRMSKMQIKELMKLCATAETTQFLPNGILYQIK